jgi:hypothetical protein
MTLEDALSVCGRGREWVSFLEEVVATQMVGRLVSAGTSIAEAMGGKGATSGLEFRQRLTAVTEETMQMNPSRQVRQRLHDLTVRAVQATYGTVGEADSKIIREEAGKPPKCFLCNRVLVMIRGEAAKNLSERDRNLAVEDEHIWPRSYGGDTIADNLALACHHCNQNKESFANWAMVDIQSLVRGLPEQPGRAPEDVPSAIRTIAGWHRYALASRAAYALADAESLTLKQAYYRLRSRVMLHPRVQRFDDVADFFNLVHHEDDA